MSIISTSKFCNLSSVNNFFDKRCKLYNWTLNLTSLLSMALRNTNEHYTNQNYLLRSFISKSLNSHNMIRSSELKAIKVFYWQNNFLFQRYLPSHLQLIKLRWHQGYDVLAVISVVKIFTNIIAEKFFFFQYFHYYHGTSVFHTDFFGRIFTKNVVTSAVQTVAPSVLPWWYHYRYSSDGIYLW